MSLPPSERDNPKSWVVSVPGLSVEDASAAAQEAVRLAREMSPKVSGFGAASLVPLSDEGWYGIGSRTPYMIMVNSGTKPRVMKELSGKGPIPMWITDDDGTMTAKVPAKDRAKRTRTTMDGRRQVLIFRKVPPIGSRKNVVRRGRTVSVPRHYPGAPGRINAKTGVFGGVWWRHPGIRPRQFIEDALLAVAVRADLEISDLYPSSIG